MSRYARERRTPHVRRKERVELNEGNIVLRLLGVGVAIVVAAVAFGTVVSNLLRVQTGWQTIEAANPETGIAEQFTLSYQIGMTQQNATAELKGVSAVYTEALEHAYRVLSNLEIEHYNNLYTLNAHPNEPVAVDELLYEAVGTLEEQRSRYAYFAPVFEQYTSLFACSDDAAAENFDPTRSEAVREFAGEIAAFANDPAMVQLERLPDCQLQLTVAPEYLRYAEENGVESYVDFGILLNAFLCDAAADALAERGYNNGYLTSFDGFIRVLCTDNLAIPVLDRQNGKIVQLTEASYNGPAALTVCRSFPVSNIDQVNYYTYSDGTTRAPYVGTDGLLHSAASSLITRAEGSVAALAINTIEKFASEELNFDDCQDISWITVDNSSWKTNGEGFLIK